MSALNNFAPSRLRVNNLLDQHFDTAFAAPDGIKKLRELILTLAMQGKLVEQDPNDPPACELLKEIEAEKQQLSSFSSPRRRGSSKSEPLPPIKQEEVPYELPQEWAWVRIRDICHDWGQKTPEARFTYIDVGAIDNKLGTIGPDIQILEGSEAPSRARKVIKPGTVIYSTVRPYLLNIAIIEKEYEPEPIASTAFAILHPFASLSARFIYHYLHSPAFVRYVESAQKGVAYPAINDGDFFGGLFPLPPLPEQHRIVARIDQLMARCDKLEKLRTEQEQKRLAVHTAAIRQLLDTRNHDNHSKAWQFLTRHFDNLYTVRANVTELRKAILQLAVMGKLVPQNPIDPPASELLKEIEAEKQRLVKAGKIKKPKPLPPIKPEDLPYELPQGWEWVRFFDPNTVKSELVSARDFQDENQIAPDSIEKGTGRLLFHRTVAESGATGPNNRFYEGQILYSKIRPSLNKVVVAPYDGLCSADMYPIICHTNTQFMLKVILSEPFLAQVRLAENRVKMPKLNLESLGQFVVPLPPLPEQYRIVVKIDQLMTLCDTLEQQIDAATGKQSELLSALLQAQPQQHADIIDLSTYRSAIGCYVVGKLANTQYFGRTAAAKVMYLAQAHVGLTLDFHPERQAAGPLDKWIYDFEQQGQRQGWFEVNEKTLATGRKKTDYRCLSALSESVAKAEALMSAEQQAEFDRLLYALAGKKTEEVEIIATLFAVWNDFLIDGMHPTDEQIIANVRENWHERKARFPPAELGRCLDWLRNKNLVPQGRPPRTVKQPRLRFD